MVQYFPVITGSLTVNGDIIVSGTSSMSASNSVSSSYAYTASSAVSSSYAYSASSAVNSFSASKAISSSYADTASFANNFTVIGNLTVFGTQSVQYITSSQLNVSDNVITVNVASPGVRFGGLSVFDSGSLSSEATASLFWDSQNNHWIYQRESGSTYDGGMLISGPRNAAGLGNELGTTACMLLVGQGGDHLTSSLVYHDSSRTCFYSNALYISSSGNVGIGTNTNINRLTLTGGSDGLTNMLGVYNNGINNTTAIGKGSAIILGGNTDGNYSAKIAMVYEGQNPSFLQPALAFYTMRDTFAYGSEVERMRITSVGNVGIGTSAPANLLHVSSSLPRIIADTSNRYAVFNMYVNGCERGAVYWDNTDNLLRVQSNQNVALSYGGNANSFGLYLSSSGNTAIKHSSPVDTLDIMGSLRIRCNTSDFNATCNSLVIDYVNTSIFGSSPTARYYSIGCTGVSAGHTFQVGVPTSPFNAFTIHGSGMVGINTDNFGTGTVGNGLIIRASSSNAGQTALIFQDYRKCNRWAVNAQSGANDATLTIYNTPNNTLDYTPVFTIGQNGQVTRPQSAAFQATINANTNIGTAGGHIQFNCVLYNPGGGYCGTNSTFTAPVSGMYQFNFVFLNQNTQNTTGGHSFLSTNFGVGTYYFTRYGCNSGTDRTGYGGYVPMFGSFAVYLPVGCKACVGAFWDADGAFSHNSTAWGNFSGYLVG